MAQSVIVDLTRCPCRGGRPPIDGLIAATAEVHGPTLVTHNAEDVARAGVRVVNPFESVD